MDRGVLYLIPVPIGNFDDITYRALEVLKDVDVLFCEDTRETGILLSHFKISKHLISNNEQNERKNIFKILEYLSDGKSVGIVSDQGSPIISDPGYVVVREVANSGFNVVALPGANALIPALIVSGIAPLPFTFYGFLNSKKSKRITELENLKNVDHTLIFYEAPHRIIEMLEDMISVFGDRYISISREISKKYEEVYRGNISDVIPKIVLKGQFVIIVSGNDNNNEEVDYIKEINDLVDLGYKSNDAIKIVAKKYGFKKDDIYKSFHGIGSEKKWS